MAIDGKWEITINSPLGAQKATLDLKAEGGALSGTQTAMQGTQALSNGKVDGNNLSWSASITSPMPVKSVLIDCGTTRLAMARMSASALPIGLFCRLAMTVIWRWRI